VLEVAEITLLDGFVGTALLGLEELNERLMFCPLRSERKGGGN
jgi:hypothetical protein